MSQKTVLVDAVHTFVSPEGAINQELFQMLEGFSEPKLILTNANEEQMLKFGLDKMPYPVFSLMHNPEKTDPKFSDKELKLKLLTLKNEGKLGKFRQMLLD